MIDETLELTDWLNNLELEEDTAAPAGYSTKWGDGTSTTSEDYRNKRRDTVLGQERQKGIDTWAEGKEDPTGKPVEMDSSSYTAPREWKGRNSNHGIEGEYVKLEDDRREPGRQIVTIRRPDGSETGIHLERLQDDQQEWVLGQAGKENARREGLGEDGREVEDLTAWLRDAPAKTKELKERAERLAKSDYTGGGEKAAATQIDPEDRAEFEMLFYEAMQKQKKLTTGQQYREAADSGMYQGGEALVGFLDTNPMRTNDELLFRDRLNAIRNGHNPLVKEDDGIWKAGSLFALQQIPTMVAALSVGGKVGAGTKSLGFGKMAVGVAAKIGQGSVYYSKFHRDTYLAGLKEDMDPGAANIAAHASAFLQAAVESFVIANPFAKISTQVVNRSIKRLILTSVGRIAGEVGEEGLQSIVDDTVMQVTRTAVGGTNAEDQGVGDILWKGLRTAVESIPTMMFLMGPGMAGGGSAQWVDIRRTEAEQDAEGEITGETRQEVAERWAIPGQAQRLEKLKEIDAKGPVSRADASENDIKGMSQKQRTKNTKEEIRQLEEKVGDYEMPAEQGSAEELQAELDMLDKRESGNLKSLSDRLEARRKALPALIAAAKQAEAEAEAEWTPADGTNAHATQDLAIEYVQENFGEEPDVLERTRVRETKDGWVVERRPPQETQQETQDDLQNEAQEDQVNPEEAETTETEAEVEPEAVEVLADDATGQEEIDRRNEFIPLLEASFGTLEEAQAYAGTRTEQGDVPVIVVAKNLLSDEPVYIVRLKSAGPNTTDGLTPKAEADRRKRENETRVKLGEKPKTNAEFDAEAESKPEATADNETTPAKPKGRTGRRDEKPAEPVVEAPPVQEAPVEAPAKPKTAAEKKAGEKWEADTRKRLKRIRVFGGATFSEFDHDNKTVKVTRKDGHETTIHFDADAHIESALKAAGKEFKENGEKREVFGFYGYKDGHIYIHSKARADTLDHEAIHWLEDMGVITSAEVAELGGLNEAEAAEYKAWMKDPNREENEKFSKAREAIAVAYGKWASDPKRQNHPIFQKMLDFLEAILGSEQGKLFQEISKRQDTKKAKPASEPTSTAPKPQATTTATSTVSSAVEEARKRRAAKKAPTPQADTQADRRSELESKTVKELKQLAPKGKKSLKKAGLIDAILESEPDAQTRDAIASVEGNVAKQKAEMAESAASFPVDSNVTVKMPGEPEDGMTGVVTKVSSDQLRTVRLKNGDELSVSVSEMAEAKPKSTGKKVETEAKKAESKAEPIKVAANDDIRFVNSGGQEFTGTVKQIGPTKGRLLVIPDGANNSVEIKADQVVGVDRLGKISEREGRVPDITIGSRSGAKNFADEIVRRTLQREQDKGKPAWFDGMHIYTLDGKYEVRVGDKGRTSLIKLHNLSKDGMMRQFDQSEYVAFNRAAKETHDEITGAEVKKQEERDAREKAEKEAAELERQSVNQQEQGVEGWLGTHKTRGKKGTFGIELRSGKTQTVEGTVYVDIGVHRTGKGWSIASIPAKVNIAGGFSTKRDAVKAAQLLQAVSWAGKSSHKDFTKKDISFVKSVREYARDNIKAQSTLKAIQSGLGITTPTPKSTGKEVETEAKKAETGEGETATALRDLIEEDGGDGLITLDLPDGTRETVKSVIWGRPDMPPTGEPLEQLAILKSIDNIPRDMASVKLMLANIRKAQKKLPDNKELNEFEQDLTDSLKWRLGKKESDQNKLSEAADLVKTEGGWKILGKTGGISTPYTGPGEHLSELLTYHEGPVPVPTGIKFRSVEDAQFAAAIVKDGGAIPVSLMHKDSKPSGKFVEEVPPKSTGKDDQAFHTEESNESKADKALDEVDRAIGKGHTKFDDIIKFLAKDDPKGVRELAPYLEEVARTEPAITEVTTVAEVLGEPKKPAKPAKPKPEAAPEAAPEDDLPGVTGIKVKRLNSQADELGQQRPREDEAVKAVKLTEEALKRHTEESDKAIQVMANDVTFKGRILSLQETADILASVTYHRKAAEAADDRANEHMANGDPASAKVEEADAEIHKERMNTVAQAARIVGRQQWAYMGHLLQVIVDKDGAAHIERMLRKANGGVETPGMKVKAKKTADGIAVAKKKQAVRGKEIVKEETHAALVERIKQLESEAKKKSNGTRKRKAANQRRVSDADKDAAIAEIRRLRSGIKAPSSDDQAFHAEESVDREKAMLVQAAIVADWMIEDHTKQADFDREMIEALGGWVKDHLPGLHRVARTEQAGANKEKLHERLNKAENLTGQHDTVAALALEILAETQDPDTGKFIERDKLLALVHKELQKVDSKITIDESTALLAGYGDYQKLSEDDLDIQYREYRAEALELSKIVDLKNKKPSKATGRERQGSTDEKRRLERVAAGLKKQGERDGWFYADEDGKPRLKGTLESQKTRLNNEIADLDAQIEAGAKTVKQRTERLTDSDLELLEQQRDAKKAQLEAIEKVNMEKWSAGFDYGADPELEAYLDVLDAQIKKLQEKLLKKDVFPAGQKKRPGGDRVDARKEQIAALKAEKDLMRLLIDPDFEANRAMKTAEAAVERDIERLKEEQLVGWKMKGEKGPKPEPSEKLLEAQAELDALREERAAALEEEYALRAAIAQAKRNTANVAGRLARGEFSPRKRKPAKTYDDPEWRKAKDEEIAIRKKLAEAIAADEWKNLDAWGTTKFVAKRTEILWKALMTGFDHTAAGLQLGITMFTNPVVWGKAMVPTYKAMRSVENREQLDAEMQADPAWDRFRNYGLAVNEHGVEGSEFFGNDRWIERMPGVAVSERIFATSINQVRFNLMKVQEWAYTKDGEALSQEQGEAIARMVNMFTLGYKPPKDAATQKTILKAAGYFFWAPSMYVARAQLAFGAPVLLGQLALGAAGKNAQFKGGADKKVQMMAGKQYVKAIVGMSAMTAILRMLLGDDEERDWMDGDDGALHPTDPDFWWKVKVGNVRMDMSSGMGQMATLVARAVNILYRGSVWETTGREQTMRSLTGSFVNYKFNPWLSGFFDLTTGKDALNRPTSIANTLLSNITPLSFQTIIDAVEEEGFVKGAMWSIPGVTGRNLSIYDNTAPKDSQVFSATIQSLFQQMTGQKTEGLPKKEFDKYLKGRVKWDSDFSGADKYLTPSQLRRAKDKKRSAVIKHKEKKREKARERKYQ